ncbi:MAG: hypothetical protein VKJ85_05425, partial [Prochlorothrix sp.]|nr:hypothetical protein [Prochlorothrix sp.]
LIDRLDQTVYQHTGQHLDTLQIAILQGVLQGKKYAEIAENYHCSEGHVKDESYKLWHTLSQLLGETVKKSNLKAAIDRFITKNNPPAPENHHPVTPSTPDPTETALQQAQARIPSTYHRRAILKLHSHGLDPAAIAHSLEIPLELVHITLNPPPTASPAPQSVNR